MPSIFDIQVGNWNEEVANEEKPVVVEFWHHKCPVCIEMKPIYKSQSEKYGNEVKFTRMNLLDIRENRKFAIANGVRSTPTFVVFCEDTPVGHIIGYRDPDKFDKELNTILTHIDNCLKSTPIKE